MPSHNQMHESGGESIRVALIEKRNEILSSLGLEIARIADAPPASEEDRPQVFHDESVAHLLNRLECELLRMIEEALDRLNAGDFGFCLACGRTISSLRLQAIPWARYCVICQNRVTNMGHESVVREHPVPLKSTDNQAARGRL